MNSMASKISVTKFKVKQMRQFLDVSGLQQCTNYYRLKYPYRKFLQSLCFLKLFKLHSEFILRSNNVPNINCCMQFMTLQALNQMFTSEKQSHVKQQAFQFYENAL